MKFKIIYKELPLYIEAEADNEDERKECLKGIVFTIQDFYKKMNLQQPQQIVVEEQVEEQVSYPATSAQIALMKKWKIPYTVNTTKDEAVALIHQYKRDHGMEDR